MLEALWSQEIDFVAMDVKAPLDASATDARRPID
jgi:hypothetical protein